MRSKEQAMDIARLEPGIGIWYRLNAVKHPVHPEKIWRGRVVALRDCEPCVCVASLDDGYNGYRGMIDVVPVQEIIACEGDYEALRKKNIPYRVHCLQLAQQVDALETEVEYIFAEAGVYCSKARMLDMLIELEALLERLAE
jgi:hypothetical protein